MATQNINTLSPGNTVYLIENGKVVPYIFLQYNHYGSSEVTLIRKFADPTAIAFRSGDNSQNAYNCYNNSNVDNKCTNLKSTFTTTIKNGLKDVSIKVAQGRTTTGGSVSSTIITLSRSVFLLSMTEVGLSGWQTEGTAFSVFNSNNARVAYNESAQTSAVNWWSRSPDSYGSFAYFVNANGAESSGYVYNTFYFRPALTLQSGILVQDIGSGQFIINADNDAYLAQIKSLVHWHKANGVWYKIATSS